MIFSSCKVADYGSVVVVLASHRAAATSTRCRPDIVIARAPAGFEGTERPYPTAPTAGRRGLRL